MELLPHQKEDSAAMAGGVGIPNFSEAGTGKTFSVLEALKLTDTQAGLIVAPTIAIPMWKEELEKYLGASVSILATGKSPVRGDADFYVTSYGLASNIELRSKLADHFTGKHGRLIADESHNLKNRTAARTKAIFGPNTNGRNGLVEVFDDAWMMTGTPILKHYDDVWSQIRYSHGDVLEKYNVLNYEDFVHSFCFSQVKKYHPRMQPKRVIVASANGRLLNRLLYEEIGAVRRTMEEVAPQMPPLTYRDVFIPIKRSSELSGLMKGIDLDAFIAGADQEDVLMTKARRLLGELKLDGCVDYALECPGPLLIGYWYTDTGDAIERLLRGHGLTVARVQGKTPMSEREKIRKGFNSGNVDVLVGQLAAMNSSWNLQECGNHVLILDDDFSPGVIEQFVKRVWRYGQSNHVQVDFIKAQHPIDEAITKVRKLKEVRAHEAIG